MEPTGSEHSSARASAPFGAAPARILRGCIWSGSIRLLESFSAFCVSQGRDCDLMHIFPAIQSNGTRMGLEWDWKLNRSGRIVWYFFQLLPLPEFPLRPRRNPLRLSGMARCVMYLELPLESLKLAPRGHPSGQQQEIGGLLGSASFSLMKLQVC